MSDADRLADAWKASYAGLPIDLLDQTEQDAAAKVRRFTCADPVAGWSVQGVASVDATPRITSLTIQHVNDDGEVTAGLIRHISFGAITAALRDMLTLEQAHVTLDHPPAVKRIGPRRGGREPMTDELFRDVAETYLAETAAGRPSRPLARMAEKYERPEETIRTWLARARKDGWLLPGIQGRAGSMPGPKLIAHRHAETRGIDG